MKKFLALIGLLVMITSCSAPRVGERMSGISIGMLKPDVIHILGKPKSVGGVSGVEVLHYTQVEPGFYRFSYYFVRLVDGKVESYGPESRAGMVTDSNPPLKK